MSMLNRGFYNPFVTSFVEEKLATTGTSSQGIIAALKVVVQPIIEILTKPPVAPATQEDKEMPARFVCRQTQELATWMLE